MRVAAALSALVLLFAGCGSGDEPRGLTGEPTAAESRGDAPAAATEEGRAIGETLAAIEAGELPYEEDGQTFQNREGLLPAAPLGYYREYTVETPGSSDRGARRLVIGAGGETYYTNDHYGSFERIDPKDYL